MGKEPRQGVQRNPKIVGFMTRLKLECAAMAGTSEPLAFRR